MLNKLPVQPMHDLDRKHNNGMFNMARDGCPPSFARNEDMPGEMRQLFASRDMAHTSRVPFHASQTQERGWRHFSTLLSRAKLPSRSFTVWGMLGMLLWATTAGSVQEMPQVGATDSFEYQPVEAELTEEMPSAEITLLEQLQARLQEVEERERGLQQREERLRALQQDLEALAARQSKEGKRLEGEASSLAEEQRRYVEQDPALVHLIKIYESMDPEEAALRIAEMREGLALDILAAIKDKKAAGVLAGVEPVKAARLSEGLRRYRDIKLNQHKNPKTQN